MKQCSACIVGDHLNCEIDTCCCEIEKVQKDFANQMILITSRQTGEAIRATMIFMKEAQKELIEALFKAMNHRLTPEEYDETAKLIMKVQNAKLDKIKMRNGNEFVINTTAKTHNVRGFSPEHIAPQERKKNE